MFKTARTANFASISTSSFARKSPAPMYNIYGIDIAHATDHRVAHQAMKRVNQSVELAPQCLTELGPVTKPANPADASNPVDATAEADAPNATHQVPHPQPALVPEPSFVPQAALISEQPRWPEQELEPEQPLVPEQPLTAAQQAQFEKSMPQVRRLAERFHKKVDGRLDLEDLIQEGSLGLVIAIRRFEPGRAPFVSFASMCIFQKMSRAFSTQSNLIRWPDYIFWDLFEQNQLGETDGLPATRKFVELRGTFAPHEEPIATDRASINLLPAAINQVLSDALTEQERDILSRRFGLNGQPERTLDQISDSYDVTRERIRQIEFGALKKLRHPCRLQVLKEAVAA